MWQPKEEFQREGLVGVETGGTEWARCVCGAAARGLESRAEWGAVAGVTGYRNRFHSGIENTTGGFLAVITQVDSPFKTTLIVLLRIVRRGKGRKQRLQRGGYCKISDKRWWPLGSAGTSGGGKKWLDSGNICKEMLTGLLMDWLCVKSVREVKILSSDIGRVAPPLTETNKAEKRTFGKLGTKGNFLNLAKHVYRSRPTYWWETERFAPRVRNETGCPLLLLLFRTVTGGSSQGSERGQKKEYRASRLTRKK